jgi:hypothetical protein
LPAQVAAGNQCVLRPDGFGGVDIITGQYLLTHANTNYDLQTALNYYRSTGVCATVFTYPY